MTLWRIVLIVVLLHVAFAGMRVTMSLFALHLGATPLTVGVLMSLLAVIPIAFAVRWGRLIDRTGVRHPMLLGTGVVLGALLLTWSVPRLETLFVMSVTAGAGFMLFHICINQAAGFVGKPEDRVRNFSVLALAYSISGVLGPTISGFAIDGIGHRNTFLLFAGASATTLVVLLAIPMSGPRPVPAGATGGGKRMTDLLRIPDLRRAFVVSAVLSMSWDLYTFVMPIYGTRLGLSATTIGLILGSFGGAIFVVRLILPLIATRLNEWHMLLGAMLITGASLAAIPTVSSVGMLMALSAALGVGLGGAQPMIMALLYNSAPAGRSGEAAGVRTLVLNVSQAGIPLLFGALGAAVGMAPVFWIMAAALGAASWYTARR